MKCCAKCGQTLPEPLPVFGVELRGNKRTILNRVHRAGKHGIDIDALIECVYGSSPDTPQNERNVIAVQVVQLNKILQKHKLRITNPYVGRAGTAVYRLVRL